MKIFKILGLLVCVSLLLTACNSGEKKAVAKIEAKSGSSVSGTVTFIEKDGIVVMKAALSGLSECNWRLLCT
jgi:Cu-Zn family superoxide dismutase